MSTQPGAVTWTGTTFAYPDGPVRLGPIDLTVEPGTVVLVVGDSGSGKSTLLRTVNGLVPHSSGGAFGGDVVVGGRSITRHRPRDLADVVGFVHQTPEAQFVVDHVEHDIAFVLENLGTDAAAMRRRVEEALDALAVAHLRDRSPATLSGGERQRCAIAGALAAAPAVLVLDEPTSMLDPQGADDVLAALGRLNDDLGTTVVVAEHRLERAGPLADRALVLEAGHGHRRRAPGRRHRHARRRPAGDPPRSPAGVGPAAAHRRATPAPPCAPPVDRRRGPTRRRPPPPPMRRRRAARRGRGPHPSGVGGPRLADGAGRRGPRGAAGEIVAVLGRNGSGKTSLLRMLAGAHQPSTGSIDASVPVAYVPQEPDSLLYSSTVRAEVEATLALLGRRDPGRGRALARRPRTSTTWPTATRAPCRWASASGWPSPPWPWATRRCWCSTSPRAASMPPPATPSNGRSSAHRDGGGAVVLATHDVELAARVATRVVVLGDGDVVADGPARHVLAGSLFAPQVLRVLPPFLTVDEVAAACPPVGSRP